jgi:hypothetical protein
MTRVKLPYGMEKDEAIRWREEYVKHGGSNFLWIPDGVVDGRQHVDVNPNGTRTVYFGYRPTWFTPAPGWMVQRKDIDRFTGTVSYVIQRIPQRPAPPKSVIPIEQPA